MKITGNKDGQQDERWERGTRARRGETGQATGVEGRDRRRSGTSGEAGRGAAGQDRVLWCGVGRGTRRDKWRDGEGKARTSGRVRWHTVGWWDERRAERGGAGCDGTSSSMGRGRTEQNRVVNR